MRPSSTASVGIEVPAEARAWAAEDQTELEATDAASVSSSSSERVAGS